MFSDFAKLIGASALVLLANAPLHAQNTKIPIKYNLPVNGQISILIKDKSGQVVRELLHAAPRKKGANSEAWDGLDDKGRPVKAGQYSWKLLSTQGLKAEYLLSIGTNPDEIWQTWPGNHNGVIAVAQDEDGVYLGGNGEGSPPLIKQSKAGKRIWSVPHWLDAWQGPTDLTVANGMVYLNQSAGKVWSVDAKTGTPKESFNILWEPKDAEFTPNLGSTKIIDLDVDANQFMVAYANHNAVRWLDAKDGKVLDEAPVPEPQAIALAPDGTALVISKGTVVSLTREDKTPKSLITGLVTPWRLAVAKNGDIFVAERGESQLVKKFSKDGKLIKTFGIKGGRKYGLYNPLGFQEIANITADNAGGFYVCEWESAPRRTAHFDANGKLLREWYGGQMYANFAYADPADPSLVWLDSHWGDVIQAKVDYLKKTWSVRATYKFAGVADGVVHSTIHGGQRWFVRKRGNETYLAREGNIQLLRVDEKAGKLVPVFISDNNIGHAWELKSPASPVLTKIMEAFRPQIRDFYNSAYTWADVNADSHVQQDEIKFVTYQKLLSENFGVKNATVPAKIASPYGDSIKVPTWGTTAREAQLLELLKWTASGAPYFVNLSATPLRWPADITDADNRSDTYQWMDDMGNRYLARNTDGKNAFGNGFWSPRVGGNRVVKWNKAGQIDWEVGKHAPGSVAKTGEAKYFWRIVGNVHGCIAVGDVEDYATHVWDQDGLYVGRLLDNPDLKAAPKEAYSNHIENFGGSLYQNPKTGNVIFYASGVNNSPVYRIRGWDQFQRQSGVIAVPSAVASLLQQAFKAETERTDLARFARLNNVTLDGSLDEWKDIRPVEIRDGDSVTGKVYLGWNPNQPDYGAPSLYAAFDVTTDKPWKTAATPQLAFQGGASVEVRLGPAKDGNTANGPLGVRVVAAPINGKASVFEFAQSRPAELNKDYSNWKPAPATYETGNGKVILERASPLEWPDVVWASQKPKADGSGYIVEMRIPVGNPVTTWPLEPRSGTRFKLDLGVTLSNPQGDHAATRLNWQSRDSNDMATQDVYTEALLRPKNWGFGVLE